MLRDGLYISELQDFVAPVGALLKRARHVSFLNLNVKTKRYGETLVLESGNGPFFTSTKNKEHVSSAESLLKLFPRS